MGEITMAVSIRTKKSAPDFGEFGADATIASDLWWLLVVRGIILLLFGLMAIIWPGITLVVLAIMFGLYLIAVGVVDVIVGARSVKLTPMWFLRVVLGIAEVAVGVYIINTGILLTIASFILLVGLFLIFQGLVEIVTSFRRSSDAGTKFWHIFGGLLGILVGMFVLREPVSGGIAFTWLLGFYGLLGGALSLTAGLGIRSHKS